MELPVALSSPVPAQPAIVALAVAHKLEPLASYQPEQESARAPRQEEE